MKFQFHMLLLYILKEFNEYVVLNGMISLDSLKRNSICDQLNK